MKLKRSGSFQASGFTLIELLIAISLMAIISVMCWRGLDGVLRSRDWLVGQSDDLKGLTLGFAQMEDDLRRSWMTRQMKISTSTIAFASTEAEKNIIAINLLRDGSQLAPGQVQQVCYRISKGSLERGFTPWSLPDPTVAQLGNNQQNMTWQPIVDRVDDIVWRVFVPGKGWLDAKGLIDPVALAQAIPAGVPVLGVEMILKRTGGLEIIRSFTVRD